MGISAWRKEQRGRADAHVARVSGCRCSFYQRLVYWYVIKPIMRTRYNIAATPHVAALATFPRITQVDIVLYLRKPSVLLAVAIVRVPAYHDCPSCRGVCRGVCARISLLSQNCIPGVRALAFCSQCASNLLPFFYAKMD